ncbi:MAG TPA: HD domain-containing protein [Iamia sp.]|nr:HD domain-containing protein [Iamia sp.]
MATLDPRTAAQLAFLVEADKLKSIVRANPLVDGSRRENSAEHSWHIALMALVLAERSDEPVDGGRAVCLCLIHDLVEIDAGDTPPWDEAGRATKAEREAAAADRLFALLPADQAATFRGWWDEFEAAETPEAKLAHAVDRLAALMVNHASGGELWRRHGRTEAMARARNGKLADWVPGLLPLATALLDDASAQGWFADPD